MLSSNVRSFEMMLGHEVAALANNKHEAKIHLISQSLKKKTEKEPTTFYYPWLFTYLCILMITKMYLYSVFQKIDKQFVLFEAL